MVEILLRRRDVGLAQQLLDGDRVGAGPQCAQRESVSQRVRTDPLGLDASVLGAPCNEVSHRANRDPVPVDFRLDRSCSRNRGPSPPSRRLVTTRQADAVPLVAGGLVFKSPE